MDWTALIMLALMVLGLIWIMRKGKGSGHSLPPRIPEGVKDHSRDDGLVAAAAVLNAALDECRRTNGEALSILASVAAFDGVVSRDELRIIFWFCAKNGARLPDSLGPALGKLNSGLKMSVENDGLPDQIATLRGRPLAYVAALYGAVVAMTCGAKKGSRQAADITARIEQVLFNVEAELRGMRQQLAIARTVAGAPQ